MDLMWILYETKRNYCIEDKRIRSFPSWVVDDIVQPGVKNEKEILKLL